MTACGEAEDRDDVDRVKRDLAQLYALAAHIRDDAHFEQLLAEQLDLEQRAAMRTLLTPMLRYPREPAC